MPGFEMTDLAGEGFTLSLQVLHIGRFFQVLVTTVALEVKGVHHPAGPMTFRAPVTLDLHQIGMSKVLGIVLFFLMATLARNRLIFPVLAVTLAAGCRLYIGTAMTNRTVRRMDLYQFVVLEVP
jgi:hypothetical protein